MMKRSKNEFAATLIGILLCICAAQGFFLGIKRIAFHFCEETLFSRSMVTMAPMLLVLAVLVFYWKANKTELKLLLDRFGGGYIAATVAAALFLAITLFLIKGFSVKNLLLIVYAGIVTPVFEELLFRGHFWNRLSLHVEKEWIVFLLVTVLFGMWHIGYAVGIYLWQGGSLLRCILMKVLWGSMYGLLLGGIRLKTGNCYLGILAHGVLNVFG